MGSAPMPPEKAQSSSEMIDRSIRDDPSCMEFGDDETSWPSPPGKTLTPSGHSQLSLRHTESACRRQGKLWQGILFGQLLSVLIALASMSAASLDDRGINLPSFVNFINYALLTFAFLGPMVVTRRSLNLPWWRYALYALVDVEANTITVLAYRYTSITSVTMLDAFSIPCVMILSRLFLQARYTSKHLAGVLLCVGGLALTVASDFYRPLADAGRAHALKGDALCILGATLYGAANVMQENFVKNHDRVEFLGMAGMFGVLLSGVQTMAFEWNALEDVTWTDPVVLFIMGYSISLFVLYCCTSLFLQAGDAALFNLSILTADIYAFAFAYIVENATPNWMYFLAAAVIFSGLFLYHSQPPTTPAESERALDFDGQMSLDEGNAEGVGPVG